MMKIHPLANLFPMCSDEEIQELADDIKLNGLRQAITKTRGDEVIEGRHRLLACEIAGIQPRFTIFDGDEDEILAYVVSANIHRRHLTASQKSMVSARLKAKEEELAAERRKRKPISDVENLPPQKNGRARDKAGEALGVSGKSVDMAVKVLTNAVPEIVSAVESGELAVSAAAMVAEMPQEQQRQIVASGGAAAVKSAAAERRIAKRKKEVSAKPDEPHGSEQNSTHANTAPQASIVLDARDIPVPQQFLEAHELVVTLMSIGRELDKYRRRAKELSEKPGGEWIDMQDIDECVRSLKRAIQNSGYHTVCPMCDGSGGNCNKCKGVGWLPEFMKGMIN